MSLSTGPVEDNFFLVADSVLDTILQVDAISGKVRAMDIPSSLNVSCPNAVEYDPVQQHIFFSDTCENVINRIKLDGSDAQVWISSEELCSDLLSL